jgi:hypothetical protein
MAPSPLPEETAHEKAAAALLLTLSLPALAALEVAGVKFDDKQKSAPATR